MALVTGSMASHAQGNSTAEWKTFICEVILSSVVLDDSIIG